MKEIVVALHDDTPLVDSILMHMGSMYTTLGKFEEANCLYARGLKIIEREFGKYLFLDSVVVKLSIAVLC